MKRKPVRPRRPGGRTRAECDDAAASESAADRDALEDAIRDAATACEEDDEPGAESVLTRAALELGRCEAHVDAAWPHAAERVRRDAIAAQFEAWCAAEQFPWELRTWLMESARAGRFLRGTPAEQVNAVAARTLIARLRDGHLVALWGDGAQHPRTGRVAVWRRMDNWSRIGLPDLAQADFTAVPSSAFRRRLRMRTEAMFGSTRSPAESAQREGALAAVSAAALVRAPAKPGCIVLAEPVTAGLAVPHRRFRLGIERFRDGVLPLGCIYVGAWTSDQHVAAALQTISVEEGWTNRALLAQLQPDRVSHVLDVARHAREAVQSGAVPVRDGTVARLALAREVHRRLDPERHSKRSPRVALNRDRGMRRCSCGDDIQALCKTLDQPCVRMALEVAGVMIRMRAHT